jgi:acyl-homoserine-lactone acylase
MGKRSPRVLTIGKVLPANREEGNLSARCYVDPSMRVLALFSMFFVASMCTHSDAQPEPKVQQGERIGTVTVYRDDWGVPHVYASREEDGFYGLGYAQAEDRLEGILRRYLEVRGESASVFGAQAVQTDLRSLQWMHADQAKLGFERFDPQMQKDYQYFIKGVERYMREHPEEVPAWAPPLDPSLPVAVLDAALWGVNDIEGVEDCSRGGVTVAKENRADPEKTGGLSVASNEWAVMPWRTKENVAIHLADSHVPFEGEVRAFEFRLHAGRLELSGYATDGIALPVTAHNRNVAWAMTAGGPDVADCYAVETDHGKPRRYLYDGEWKEMITKRVTVQVRGSASVTREFEYTRHNGVLCPVVARNRDMAYVVSSAYMEKTGLVDQQLYRMDLSTNMGEFKQAMAIEGMFTQNIMAASSEGHILYIRAGRVPIRPAGYDFRKPVPGNTSATAWKGIHPLDDLVVVEDPAAGYMANNNVAPDAMTKKKLVDAANYSFEAFFDLPGFTNARNRRAIEVLSSAFAFSEADALELALDEKWEGTEDWIAALGEALEEKPQTVQTESPAFRRFADRILHFDGVARKESVAALDYLYWRVALTNDPAGSEKISQAIENHKDLSSAQQDALFDALERALRSLTTEHGSADIALGDVYRIGRGGSSWPIGGVKFETAGPEATTMRAMQAGTPDSNGQRWVTAGQRQPCLTIFSNPIRSFTSAPWGQSDHAKSPHYSDQARLASERRLKPTYFNREDLMKHVASKQVLSVE